MPSPHPVHTDTRETAEFHPALKSIASYAARARGKRSGKWGKPNPWPDSVTHSPSFSSVCLRREGVEAGLALAGAILGWMTPLALKHVEGESGGSFYQYGEEILCPLFACFGAGLGLMFGVLWGARRREETNEQRPSAERGR